MGATFVFPFPGNAPRELVLELAGKVAARPWGFVGDSSMQLVAVALEEFSRDAPAFPVVTFFGPNGCGKSLLAHGIARLRARREPHNRPAVFTGGSFSQSFGLALETNSIAEFRRRVQSHRTLAIDDVQRLTGRNGAQEELVYAMDAMERRGEPVVITADESLQYDGSFLPALRSRLLGGLTISVGPLDTSGLSLLASWTAQRFGMHLEPQICAALAEQFTAERGTSTVASSTADFINYVLRLLHLLLKEQLTPGKALTKLSAMKERQVPSPRLIVQRVAKRFAVRPSDLRGPGRYRNLAQARSVAMYLLRRLTGQTLQQVATYFGRSDHTTVLHACRQLERRLRSDKGLRQIVDELTQGLGQASE